MTAYVSSRVLDDYPEHCVAARRLTVAAVALDSALYAIHVWPHAKGCPDKALRPGRVTVSTVLIELMTRGWLTNVEDAEGGFWVERAPMDKLEDLVSASKRAVEKMIAERDGVEAA